MREDKIRRREELRKKNKKKSSILPVILTVLIAFGIGCLSLFYYMTTPVDKNNNNEVTIEVKENYGSSKVAEQLLSKGLIRNELVFKAYLKLNSSSQFYVGNFKLKPSMNLSTIIDELTNSDKAKSARNMTVVEGENVEKIAEKIAATIPNTTKEDVLAKVNDTQFINQLKSQYPELITAAVDDVRIKYALEGYLYPSTYDISDNETMDSLLLKMIKQTNDVVLPKYKADNRLWTLNNQKVKPTIHQYITMASILEKESTYDGDNNKIAGVFLNRLSVNMPLQTDPTVYYSVGRTTGGLSAAELQNSNPYNTYVNRGLPPGPIASAGIKSYDALNNAENHDYLYFLNAKDGKAYFAKTYAEHEELAKQHIEGYVATGSRNNG